MDIIISKMSAYPPALRTVLKAFPAVLWMFTSTVVFGTAMYNLVSHPTDHAPRPYYRTHRLEKSLRFREDLTRNHFHRLLNYNPNTDYLSD